MHWQQNSHLFTSMWIGITYTNQPQPKTPMALCWIPATGWHKVKEPDIHQQQSEQPCVLGTAGFAYVFWFIPYNCKTNEILMKSGTLFIWVSPRRFSSFPASMLLIKTGGNGFKKLKHEPVPICAWFEMTQWFLQLTVSLSLLTSFSSDTFFNWWLLNK